MKKSTDYVGKRSLSLPVNTALGRFQLVGYELLGGTGKQFIDIGSHVVEKSEGEDRSTSIGYVTSACFSPTLNRAVAMGHLKDGRSRMV